MEPINPKTGMTRSEAREFVNRKNVQIVIWRIAARQIVERWAYLEAPRLVE